jgi:hypothetical protein
MAAQYVATGQYRAHAPQQISDYSMTSSLRKSELRPQIRRVDAAIVACTMIKVKPM